jgi:hypothetical protein
MLKWLGAALSTGWGRDEEGVGVHQEARAPGPDEKLGEIFDGKKQVTMFELTKLISKHLS